MIKNQRLLIDYRGIAARFLKLGTESGAFPHIEGQSPTGLRRREGEKKLLIVNIDPGEDAFPSREQELDTKTPDVADKFLGFAF